MFPGITDGKKVYSNVSGDSNGLYDGIKAGGVRVGLDIFCGSKNELYDTTDSTGKVLKRDSNGYIHYKGPTEYPTMDSLMATNDASGLYGPTGGFQGTGGMLPIVGAYQTGTFWENIGDSIVESFAGTHDFIGGELPGFYDSEGNTTRGRSDLTNIAANTWTVVATPIAAPFSVAIQIRLARRT